MTQALVAGMFGLQALLGLTVVEAVRRRDISASLNAAVALIAALLPFGIEIVVRWSARPTFTVGPELPFWIAVAGLIHSIGMLGRYDTTWWWDHLAHGISAGLLAALIYGSLIVLFGPASGWSRPLIQTVTVGGVMLAGVAWEVLELAARLVGDRYGIDPVLVNYGPRDTAYDLVFDFVGAVIVVGLDMRVFVPLAAFSPGFTKTVLVWSLGSVVIATVATGLWVGLSMIRTNSG